MATIKFWGKTSDLFSLVSGSFEYEGYPPAFLGKQSDMVALEIDVESGQVVGWDSEACKAWLEEAARDKELALVRRNRCVHLGACKISEDDGVCLTLRQLRGY